MTVTAQVAFGGEPATLNFSLWKRSGQWCINQPTARVNLEESDAWLFSSGYARSALPALLNDIPITGRETIHLFPGTYELTTSNKLVTLSNNLLTVRDLAEGGSLDVSPTITFTDAVQKTFASMADADLQRCLTEKTTRTTCGFGTTFQGDLTAFYAGRDIDLNSLRWSIQGRTPDLTAWKVGNAREIGYAVPATIGVLSLQMTATRLDGSDVASQIFDVMPAIDITDPDNPRVVWKAA